MRSCEKYNPVELKRLNRKTRIINIIQYLNNIFKYIKVISYLIPSNI